MRFIVHKEYTFTKKIVELHAEVNSVPNSYISYVSHGKHLWRTQNVIDSYRNLRMRSHSTSYFLYMYVRTRVLNYVRMQQLYYVRMLSYCHRDIPTGFFPGSYITQAEAKYLIDPISVLHTSAHMY